MHITILSLCPCPCLNVHDPRTAMMTFAIDRIQKEYPELPIATAKFLLRAEARTLTSVLNAKIQDR